MNVNKVTVAGRLCADPVLKYLPSQTAVVNIRVATNRRWKTDKGEDRDEATFWEMVAFGKTAEAINSYLQKGREIYCECHAKTESWDDKQSGQKRSKMVFVIESFQFVGPKPEGDGPSEPRQQRQAAKTRQQPSQTFDPTEDVEFADPSIPF